MGPPVEIIAPFDMDKALEKIVAAFEAAEVVTLPPAAAA